MGGVEVTQPKSHKVQISPKSDNEPSVYLDSGIKIEVPAIPNLEALRKATEYLYRLYLSHSADSGGT